MTLDYITHFNNYTHTLTDEEQCVCGTHTKIHKVD